MRTYIQCIGIDINKAKLMKYLVESRTTFILTT